jgi:hypothetical protein
VSTPLASFTTLHAVNTPIEAAETLVEFPDKGRLWELMVKFGARNDIIGYRRHENLIIIVRIWHHLEAR